MVKAKDIMTRKVITIEKDAKVSLAAKKMAEKSISCIVVTSDNKPEGIITERLLLREILVRG